MLALREGREQPERGGVLVQPAPPVELELLAPPVVLALRVGLVQPEKLAPGVQLVLLEEKVMRILSEYDL